MSLQFRDCGETDVISLNAFLYCSEQPGSFQILKLLFKNTTRLNVAGLYLAALLIFLAAATVLNATQVDSTAVDY